MTTEIGTQVDTHIIDTHIDAKYRWNEWELRRHALLLVNLKTKKTHSSQTYISHFRRESETQHYNPKYYIFHLILDLKTPKQKAILRALFPGLSIS